MINWFYSRKNIEIMVLITVIYCSLAYYLPEILHLIPGLAPTEISTRLGTAFFAPLGACNSFLIGFLLNQAVQNYREVKNLAAQEASHINNLDRLLLRFGDEHSKSIRVTLSEYIDQIISEEWGYLSEGHGCENCHMHWRKLAKAIAKLEPTTPRQNALYVDILKRSAEVSDCRELRIQHSTTKLPGLYWFVIFIGMMSLVAVNSLFIRSPDYILALMILPFFVGTLVSLLVITDRPFKGEGRITAQALIEVRNSIATRHE